MGVNYLIPRVIRGHLIMVSHNLGGSTLLPASARGYNVVMRFETGQIHTPSKSPKLRNHPQNKGKVL